MTLTLTAAEPVLKELYPYQKIMMLTYKNRPFLAMMRKDENFVGSLRKSSLKYGNSQNRSTKFSVAKEGNDYQKYEDFKITRVPNYSFASVDNETIQASQSDRGAFIDTLKDSMDGAIESLSNSLGYTAFADGSYKIAQRASESGGTVTLSDANDTVNLEVGMKLDAHTGLTGTTVRAGYITVTAVDRENGTFDYTGTITGFADDDYLFPHGDKGRALSGAQAWIPVGSGRATALAASFFGVTRNVDSTRLGGWYIDRTSAPIEEALVEGIVILDREGSVPDAIFLNPLKWKDLVNSLGSKKVYVNTTVAGVSFRGVEVEGPNGPVAVYSDRWCPFDYALIAQMNTWCCASLGPLIHIFNTDGLTVLRSQVIDGVDIQVNSYAQIENRAPGYNMWVKLS